MVNILVTGASGYIGQHLCRMLNQEEFTIFPIVRDVNKRLECIPEERHIVIADCNEDTDWLPHLKHIDVIIHLMARAHKPYRADSDILFQKENVDVFCNIIDHSLAQGVKQIIFLSSIGVNGEMTRAIPFRASDIPNPKGAYAKSKWQAEMLLKNKLENTATAFTIIRPPLVYHGGKEEYKGNLRLLEKLIATKLPLPLGNIQNQRSMVNVQNLHSLIHHCIQNSSAYNKTFLVADPNPLTTTKLLKLMSADKVWLFTLPKWVFAFGFVLLHKQAMHKKIFGDLEVDITETTEQLGWVPPFTADECFNLYDS